MITFNIGLKRYIRRNGPMDAENERASLTYANI